MSAVLSLAAVKPSGINRGREVGLDLARPVDCNGTQMRNTVKELDDFMVLQRFVYITTGGRMAIV
jgi:hypothetical protein